MKILKRTGLVFLTLIILLALWIAINSIDDAELSPLAKEMLKPFPEVPPEENGYNDVAYLNIGFEEFKKTTGIDGLVLSDAFINNENDNLVQKMIKDNNKMFESISESNRKKHFQIPALKDEFDVMFSYSNINMVWKLIILDARIRASNGDIDEALDLLDAAALSIERMRGEESHHLISYLVCIGAHSRALSISHYIASNNQLTKSQTLKLINVLNRIGRYQDDKFRETIYREMLFKISDISSRYNFHTIDRVKRGVIHAESLYAQIVEYGSETAASRNSIYLYDIFIAIFPKYYIHENHNLNEFSSTYSLLIDNTDNFCEQAQTNLQSLIEEKESFPVWRDIVRPNSYKRLSSPSQNLWGREFERRCLYHSYVSAIKIITAIHWYQSEHHKLPDTLDNLVPGYLNKIPIDYFDGKPMRYSKENRWVYSVGADYKDDGGSKDDFYRGGCSGMYGKKNMAETNACRMNPTVPINWNDYPAELR